MKKSVSLVQSNKLTNARYELSLIEKRIVYFLLREVRNTFVVKKDGDRTLFDNLIIRTHSDVFLKDIDESNTKRVKDAFKSLRQRSFEWQNEYPDDHPEHEWFEVGFINHSEWHRGGEIAFEVSKIILPFFVELTQNFTVYDSLIAMSLRSKYSQRFYEYCCQWREAGGFNISIKDLREQLMLEDSYTRYGALKRYVIDVAHKELKELYEKGECDTYFEYSELKKGRSVDSLKIKVITKNKGETVYKLEDITYFVRTDLNSIFDVKNKPKNQEFVNKTMGVLMLDVEKLKHCYKRLKSTVLKLPKNEQAKYMRYIINTDYLTEKDK